VQLNTLYTLSPNVETFLNSFYLLSKCRCGENYKLKRSRLLKEILAKLFMNALLRLQSTKKVSQLLEFVHQLLACSRFLSLRVKLQNLQPTPLESLERELLSWQSLQEIQFHKYREFIIKCISLCQTTNYKCIPARIIAHKRRDPRLKSPDEKTL